MTKITTDFVGSETIAVTKQRLTDILAYWGASTAAYTTWGQARTALNALLTSTTAGTIGSTELAGSFLPKINFLNDPDDMIADALFGAGEQGVWLDPSDLTTMFQDAAGTTPVTAPGQPVGLRLDKSKGLVLGSEIITNGDFSGGATTGWTATRSTLGVSSGSLVVTGTSTYPGVWQSFTTVAGRFYKVQFSITSMGTASTVRFGPKNGDGDAGATLQTADYTTVGLKTAYFAAISSQSTLFILAEQAAVVDFSLDNISVKELAGNHAVQSTAGSRPMYGVEPKGGRRNLLLATDTLATQSLTVTAAAHTLAFTGTGTVTLSGASTAGPLVGTGAGNRVSLTFTPTAASLTLTVSGSVTLAQLELGSSATNYQKVVTAFDVTEAGVNTCHYCQYDGSDDGMITNSIDFTATDKMSVFAGVRKLSDAAVEQLIELSPQVSVYSGSFSMPASDGGATWVSAVKGTGTIVAATATGLAAPISTVNTALMDLALTSGETKLRINGVQVAASTGDTGGGNFRADRLNIGRRGNDQPTPTLPFNGRDYGIIVTGKLANATAISTTEMWLANKTPGVSL